MTQAGIKDWPGNIGFPAAKFSTALNDCYGCHLAKQIHVSLNKLHARFCTMTSLNLVWGSLPKPSFSPEWGIPCYFPSGMAHILVAKQQPLPTTGELHCLAAHPLQAPDMTNRSMPLSAVVV